MRYIAIFLLIANIAYFGWQQFVAAPIVLPAAPEPRPLLSRGLSLVSEYAEQSAQLAAEQAIAARVCHVVGEFSSIDDANEFLQRAETQGYLARVQLGGEQMPSNYRVYLPPASSRAIAAIILDGLSERLEEELIRVDTYLITRGLLENAIALGVFGELSAAELVREQVSALGYSAQIEEIPNSTGAIQLLLATPDFTSINAAEWLDFAGDRPDLARAENLCETIAPGGQFP